LALDDREVRRGRERLDPPTRPDEREPEREVDLPAPARPLAVDEAEPLGGDLRPGHPRPNHPARMLHHPRRDLLPRGTLLAAVSARAPALLLRGEPHALDLLRGLAGARRAERRRRVDGA